VNTSNLWYLACDQDNRVMTENQQQTESVNEHVGVPARGRIDRSLLTLPKKRIRIRRRATRTKTYHIGMTHLNGKPLAGELKSVRPAVKGSSNRNPIATIKCIKCGKTKDLRMDHYLYQNETCGCGGVQNRADQIEKVINVVGHQEEDLAKALESGSLPSQGDRGSYKATRVEIYEHFGLVPSKGGNRVKTSTAKALIHLGWAVKYACARIQNRWKQATWKRLGQTKVLRIAEAVRDFGLKWTASNICGGCTATAHACMRWVLQDMPQIDNLCCA
jgi:hypothetical protein